MDSNLDFRLGSQPVASVGGVSYRCDLPKAAFDRMFALVALFLLLPLFAVLACAIKASSPGPVFFRQERAGLGGRPFTIYKFRSMRVHDTEPTSLRQACPGDPRCTRVGAFMRRTSLDELPQFINVLRGEMSIVGPRPHALQHDWQFGPRIDRYFERYQVKPGITGLAQMNGWRGETATLEAMQARVWHDLEYIQRRSFWLDLRIVLWTAFKGWAGEAAY